MWTDPFGREPRYAPPPGWLRPERESFNADEDWKRLIEAGPVLPDYSGPTSVRFIRGDCLEPLLVAGQHAIQVRPVAADEPLVDGGMYSIEWDEETEPMRAYYDKHGISPTEKIQIVKFLRFICGEWWCQCKDSIARLEGRVVAQVVSIVSLSTVVGCTGSAVHARQPACGNPFDSQSAQCGQVSPNAVTDVLNSVVAGPIGSGQASTILYTVATLTFTATTDGSFTSLATFVAGFVGTGGSHVTQGPGSLYLQVVTPSGGTQTAQVGDVTEVRAQYGLQIVTNMVAGETATVKLFLNSIGTVTPAIYITATNATTKVELIKR